MFKNHLTKSVTTLVIILMLTIQSTGIALAQGNIDQSFESIHDGWSGSTFFLNVAAHAQSFIPTVDHLDSVELLGDADGSSSVRVSIHEGTPDGTELGSVSGSWIDGWNHYDFATSIPLVPGNLYTIRVSRLTGNPLWWFRQVDFGGANYPNGTAWHCIPTCFEQGARDFTFRTFYLPADNTPPNMTITTPSDGTTYLLGQIVNAEYNCQDETDGSGLASCQGTVANGSVIDTSPVGPKSFTVNATDNAGNPASLSHNYSVIYNFSGFSQPVDNLPTLNTVKGGAGVAVKFSLGGDQGLNILASGYPISQQVSCAGGLPVDEIEQTVAAGNSSLSYDAATATYTYTWKTNKAWTGTCRQLILMLSDGTEHKTNFKFK